MIAQDTQPASSTIIIIDDETYVADAISAALTHEGLTAIATYDGVSGIAAMSHMPVDLIILDLMMPLQTGEDVFLKIRNDQRFIRLPIILISAGVIPSKGSYDAYTRFLSKPFYLDELLNLVRTFLTEAKEQ